MEINPQSDALKWLLEMELIQDPNVLNSLILNIHKTSKTIRNVEFVTDLHNKRVLVYLDIKPGIFWGKQRKIATIIELTENILNDALPSFEKRVTVDRALLDRAIKIVSATK